MTPAPQAALIRTRAPRARTHFFRFFLADHHLLSAGASQGLGQKHPASQMK